MDYKNYGVAYECRSSPTGEQINYIWLISRKSTISNDEHAQVKEIILKNFNTFDMKEIIQDERFCEPRLDIGLLNSMWNDHSAHVYNDFFNFNFQLDFKMIKKFDSANFESDVKFQVKIDFSRNNTSNNAPT